MIKKIKGLLNTAQKRSIFGLVVLSILISGIETVGISAILPFISVASDFSLVTDNKYYHYAYTLFGFSDVQSFVVTFGFVLIAFYVSRGIFNLCYMYFIQRYSQGVFISLATKIFSNYVHIKYQDMTTRNSSDLSKKLITETNNAAMFFYSLLLLISELFVSSFLYTALLAVNWKVTFALTGLLGLMILLLVKIISRLIKKEGLKRNHFQEIYYRTISETLSNLKFIKLMAGEETAVKALHKSGQGYVNAMVMNNTYNTVPRLSLESIGFSLLIAALIYALMHGQNVATIIPVVSLFALAMYRMLPSVNRILSSYNNMLYYTKSIELLHDDLNIATHKLGSDPLEFNEQINIRKMSFGYTDDLVLKNINMNIKKGEKIALIGESGAGKSTLADIIIGMYTSFSGNIDVDDNGLTETNMLSWRKKIGYIPQSIYLFDSTVAENVTFGRDHNEQQIKEALDKAELSPFLEQNEGINTPVGEDGSQLSGGQKQRIAIARAIYGNPDLLVLDEATSALDSQTEKRIMDHIFKVSKGKTLIIIAHRLSTIEQCDKVYKIEDKGIRLIEDKNTLKG
ncbi:ABC transporter ATP-binding protein [Desulfovibrio sp. JC022]|uniref:ABC transporter ATP-binding protein/permease n=1 Tax=Desulfovibrio sp. JC022 TaxID=2593642 RepID=UPI0013D81348|nr:ABC transporter ATP-binding protein [Desulfovibrio sp. JC022]NDV22168.1 ABC transporter ATP-binding protein [Desulfovibrio sp. JC022]